LKITENNKRKANEEVDVVAHKIRKNNEDFGDNGIYWCVDNERFDKYIRDQLIVNYYENRIDKVSLKEKSLFFKNLALIELTL
jgi:hypothetical protein